MSWEVFSSLISASPIPAWESSFHRSGSMLFGSHPTWVTCLPWRKQMKIPYCHIYGKFSETTSSLLDIGENSLESAGSADVCFGEFGALFLALLVLLLFFAAYRCSSRRRHRAVAWRLDIWVLDVHCGHAKRSRAKRWGFWKKCREHTSQCLISGITGGGKSYSRDVLRWRSHAPFPGGGGGREPLSRVTGKRKRGRKHSYSHSWLDT